MAFEGAIAIRLRRQSGYSPRQVESTTKTRRPLSEFSLTFAVSIGGEFPHLPFPRIQIPTGRFNLTPKPLSVYSSLKIVTTHSTA